MNIDDGMQIAEEHQTELDALNRGWFRLVVIFSIFFLAALTLPALIISCDEEQPRQPPTYGIEDQTWMRH